MIKKLCLNLFFLLFISPFLIAQYQLSGTVADGADDHLLAGASVFINGSSKGTVTDKNGYFSITGVSFNIFELIVSYVSYETMIIKITPENIGKRFKILMASKQNTLKEVVIEPVERDGWKTWGKLFVESFLGTSNNARECIIKNPEVLRFRYNKKTHVLTVSSVDMMIIKNNALGYTINYQLEEFKYDNRMISFIGYSSFEPMQSNRQRKMTQWNKHREEAFNGSLMHFIRSLYINKANEEGFKMTYLIRLFKKDTSTAEYYNKIMNGNYSDVDTSKFFIQIMKPEGMSISAPIIYLIGKKPLLTDDIRKTDSSGTIYASFNNCIQLTYVKELEKDEYLAQMSPMRKTKMPQTSIIYLVNNQFVIIDKSGLYFEPLDLFSEGYMAWEKFAEMLPTDYEP